jgi:hypothetical protein
MDSHRAHATVSELTAAAMHADCMGGGADCDARCCKAHVTHAASRLPGLNTAQNATMAADSVCHRCRISLVESTHPKHQASYLIQGPGGCSIYGTSSPLQLQEASAFKPSKYASSLVVGSFRRLCRSKGAVATPHLYQLPVLLEWQWFMLLRLMHATGHLSCQN